MARNPLNDMTFGDLFANLARFGEMGFFDGKLDVLMRDPDHAREAVGLLREYFLGEAIHPHPVHPADDLIHGVFMSTEEVVGAFKRRRDTRDLEHGWKFSDEDINQILMNAPVWTQDAETGIALFGMLTPPDGSTIEPVQLTFEEGWSWAASRHPCSQRRSDLKSDPNSLHLVQGVPAARMHPGDLRWVRIKLDSHQPRPPRDVDHATRAGLELLFLAAEHPHRVRAMNGKDRPSWNLSAIEFVTAQYTRGVGVPCLDYEAGRSQVSLVGNPPARAVGERSSPVILV